MNEFFSRPKPKMTPRISRGARVGILLAVAVLAISTGVFGYLYFSGINTSATARSLLARRIDSNLVDAISQVNRMSGSVQSNSFIKIGQIRQHVYAMDEVNAISVGLLGEKGRFIPQEALDALFADLDRYEITIQTATGNTLEDRTLLLTHLTALQTALQRRN